jgi:hypothetical protein
MPEYDTGVVYNLLTQAYGPSDLCRTCRDNTVLKPICRLVNRDWPISDIADAVIEYCEQHQIFEQLFQIVCRQRESQYRQHEPYLKASADQPLLLPRSRKDARFADLLLELAEWKLIHNSAQQLVNAVGYPVDVVTTCRLTHQVTQLELAGRWWQESCVKQLEGLPDKWNLQYAYSPVVDTLRDEIADVENITRRLCGVEDIGEEFMWLYSRLTELKGTLWEMLTVADKSIMMLIETIQQMVEGQSHERDL